MSTTKAYVEDTRRVTQLLLTLGKASATVNAVSGYQKIWDDIDAAAEREAIALKHAPRRKRPRTGKSFSMDQEQAIWDECLAIRYRTCQFCGKTLQDSDNTNNEDEAKKSHKQPQDNDICKQCRFLERFQEPVFGK